MSKEISKSEKVSNYAKSIFYIGSLVITLALASFYVKQLSPQEGSLFYSYSEERFNNVENIKAVVNKNYTKKNYEAVSDSRAYLLDFQGSMMAEEVFDLRSQVDIILAIAKPEKDIVLLNLTSPGGTVTGYSLASNQLDRLRRANIKLVAMVDIVAASGGYMMASVANEIVAAPNAIVGSIGVVAEFPNFNNLLKKLGVEWKQYTAGDYKRTVGQFSGISEEGENHFKGKLSSIHKMFKDHVSYYRPNLKNDKIFTGETWTAQQSVSQNLGLVDQVSTSDDYILQTMKTHEVYHFEVNETKSVFDRLMASVVKVIKKEHFKVSIY